MFACQAFSIAFYTTVAVVLWYCQWHSFRARCVAPVCFLARL